MKDEIYKSFSDFYPFYLSQHRLPVTRGLHIVGICIALLTLVSAVVTRQWFGLFAVPVLGYGPAWVGHFFFEKNRPATFRYPLYSLMGDFVMMRDTVLGRLPPNDTKS